MRSVAIILLVLLLTSTPTFAQDIDSANSFQDFQERVWVASNHKGLPPEFKPIAEKSSICNASPVTQDFGPITPSRLERLRSEALAEISKLRTRADGGDQQAVASLCVYQNHFLPPDYADAAKWCQIASEKGDSGAQNQLGILYRDGLGLKQNYSEAVKWWLKAAESKYTVPPCELAYMYADGKGAPQDWQEAYFWATQYSIKIGYRNRTQPVDAEKHLTEAQKAAVDARIEIWMKAHPDWVSEDNSRPKP